MHRRFSIIGNPWAQMALALVIGLILGGCLTATIMVGIPDAVEMIIHLITTLAILATILILGLAIVAGVVVYFIFRNRE